MSTACCGCWTTFTSRSTSSSSPSSSGWHDAPHRKEIASPAFFIILKKILGVGGWLLGARGRLLPAFECECCRILGGLPDSTRWVCTAWGTGGRRGSRVRAHKRRVASARGADLHPLLRANLYEFQKFKLERGEEPYFNMPRLQASGARQQQER